MGCVRKGRRYSAANPPSASVRATPGNQPEAAREPCPAADCGAQHFPKIWLGQSRLTPHQSFRTTQARGGATLPALETMAPDCARDRMLPTTETGACQPA